METYKENMKRKAKEEAKKREREKLWEKASNDKAQTQLNLGETRENKHGYHN